MGRPLRATSAEVVKKNVTIDWTVRENVRAQLRVLVKRILRKYGYPPDKQEQATKIVLEQAGGLIGNVGGGVTAARDSVSATVLTVKRAEAVPSAIASDA